MQKTRGRERRGVMNKLMGRGNLTDQRDYTPFDVATHKHSYKDTHMHNLMMPMSLLPELNKHYTTLNPRAPVSIFS